MSEGTDEQTYIQQLEFLQAENEKLREVNSQTWCAYCGKTYPRTADSMEQIREHIATCEKHPMRELETEIALLRLALEMIARVVPGRMTSVMQFVQNTARSALKREAQK